jgi:cytochrome c
MKASTLSTLWDYINRAMPWNAPKSLKHDEVYAVTAYLLNLGGVVPDELVLSDRNFAEVQKLLPNRNGMTTDHGLWPGKSVGNGGKADVKAVACMKDCAPEPQLASFLPDFARNAHGNLAEQNRGVGEQRGADTTRPAATTAAAARASVAGAAVAPPKPAESATATAVALAKKYTCLTCHGVENKVVGPAFRDVAKKYQGRADILSYLAGKIRSGGTGLWGPIPMPPQALSEADARTLAAWLAQGAPQ